MRFVLRPLRKCKSKLENKSVIFMTATWNDLYGSSSQEISTLNFRKLKCEKLKNMQQVGAALYSVWNRNSKTCALY